MATLVQHSPPLASIHGQTGHRRGGDKNSSSAEPLPCASRSREALQNPAHPSLSSPRGRRCHALYLTPGRLRTMQPAGSRLSPVTCSSAAISAWCYQLHKREREKASLGSQFGGCFGPTDKQQDLVRGPEWSQAAHHLMTQKSKLE